LHLALPRFAQNSPSVAHRQIERAVTLNVMN
jgi:hypothetical protein